MGTSVFPGSVDRHHLLRESIFRHIRYTLARNTAGLTARQLLKPLSLAVRDLLVDGMLDSEERFRKTGAKRLYYLSMEFLIGRSLGDSIFNLRLSEDCRQILAELGVDLDQVLECEADAGLGNGGLGRLAACFLESMATLGLPGYGYGIDYDYGLFKQEIVDGYQREKPDKWKDDGVPFYIERSDEPFLIPLYGRVEGATDSHGNYKRVWVDYKAVIGLPHDLPIAGLDGKTVNWLRLFSARSSNDFNLESFNNGDYIRAVEDQIASENISRVLYPSDSVMSGKELRLLQEYFLVACSLKDIVRRYRADHDNFDDFPSQVAVQMNDTHPSLAVPELMRVLVDGYEIGWERAWDITQASLAYTNHTLLPEALEKWPVSLMRRVLPRHMEIIAEINRRFMETAERAWPMNWEKRERVSVFEGGGDYQQVRMANLAIIGSHSVNGVSELHSNLLKTTLCSEFNELDPHKFNNKTNGVAPRRWLLKANQPLSALLTTLLGERWITDLSALSELQRFSDDEAIQSELMKIKRENKTRLAGVIRRTTGVVVDTNSIFDVQVKRIHEYKRQLLNVMRIVHEYLRITEDGGDVHAPRAYIFAGKAAPGYWAAKQIIKLIHNVARVVNSDPRVADRMKIAFIPDYRVSLAEVIMPAADISEQISTAGMEASGTGNMKLAMNGALTVGTLDGANIELMEEVGADNIYIFGFRADEIASMRQHNLYDPPALYHRDQRLRRVMDAIGSDMFCADSPGLFRWIFDSVLYQGDRYFHLADLPSYLEISERAEKDYTQSRTWARKALLNVARCGKFSSDRTILEYARDIWHLGQFQQPHAPAVPVQVPQSSSVQL